MIKFSPAADQLFRKIDANHNGITVRELQKLDKNHNGSLSAKEAPQLTQQDRDLINQALKAVSKAKPETLVFPILDSPEQTRVTNAPPNRPSGARPPGEVIGVAKGTGYYPHDDPQEGGFVDKQKTPLATLQDYLEGKVSYVSIALDANLYTNGKIDYGDTFRIPEIEAKYGRPIVFKAVDCGGAFLDKGYHKVDICTRTEEDTFEETINGKLTLIRTED